MVARAQDPADEIKHLQRCINDLISVLALPAAWTGTEPSDVARNLLEALLRLLQLDFVALRIKDPADGGPAEYVRVASTWQPTLEAPEIRELITQQLGDNPQRWPAVVRSPFRDQNITLVPLRLGLNAEMGLLVAASRRADFPTETEKLVLSAAANQGAIGLREAELRNELKRAASELDQRVAERTAELARVNEELRKEIMERRLAETRLREEERELRHSEARKTAILNSALDCIVTIDHQGRITEFNPAAETTFGHRREEVMGRPLADVIIPPSVAEKHRQGLARYVATGETNVLGRRIEMTAVRADGTEFPVELAITRIPFEGPPSFTGYMRDITERQHREGALRAAHERATRSEERWRSVFQNSAVGIALTDLNGRYLATNPVFQRMMGYSEAEMLQLSFVDITEEEHVELNRALISELLAGKRREFQMEKQYRRKDGSLVWVRNNVSVVPGSEHVPRFLMAIVEDISDRKRAEDALRASEFHLRQTVDSIPGLVATLSAGGDVEFLNRQTLEYFGRSNEELKNWALLGAVHPDDLPRVLDVRSKALRTGQAYDVEYRCQRADGEYRWFQVRGLPVHDDAGAVTSWYLLLTDIEERKKAEEMLRRSEAFLAEGQHLSRTGSFSWRVGSGEIIWSEELYRIFDFEQGVPVTLERISARLHPDDIPTLQGMVGQMRSGVRDIECEPRLQMPDHSVRHLLLIAHGSRNLRREWEYIGAVQDVTLRRAAEEALRKAQAELAQVARISSLGVLTASIAHEVNQPLSGIVTNASTCLRMLAADPPNVDGARETARRTIRDGNRASDVITRLRALFSRKAIATELLDLNEAAREVVAIAMSELQQNRVLVRQELAGDLPRVRGDRVQLQQVILNLLRNAADAMSGIEDRPRHLLIRTGREGDEHVCLAVQDAGVGFDPKTADRLFEAFHTTKSDGMGIGLSVSRSIIESHDGRLWAALNDGPGATFSFSLPRGDERNQQPSAGPMAAPDAADAAPPAP